MMITPQEFLDREASSWAAFEAQVMSVPQDRREVPGVVGDWTVKDMVWHCAYWSRFAADHLDAAGAGPFMDPFDADPDRDWDAVNGEVAAASAAMSWDEVVAGGEEARAGLRAAVVRPNLAPERIAWAADETWVHYDEHAAEVRAFADSSDG